MASGAGDPSHHAEVPGLGDGVARARSETPIFWPLRPPAPARGGFGRPGARDFDHHTTTDSEEHR
ncbi:MAG: hypothetical protein JST08_01260 [Actinobacteria bacterium]|nr:hypothetical protein [Actinomycetota bacterium]